MFLNLHTLFTLPVNCLNRDDAGRPKTAVVHGIERTRQSSQSLKAAYRRAFRDTPLHMADRTKNLYETIRATIGDRLPSEEAEATARALVSYIGSIDKDKSAEQGRPVSSTLALVTPAQLEASTEVILEHAPEIKTDKEGGTTFALTPAKKIKDRIKGQGTHRAVVAAMNSRLSADQLLFGRMFASHHELDVDAVAQVAHMIGTGPSSIGTDFFTAVDDLSTGGHAGSGHMSIKRFSAGTAYGFSTLDLSRLRSGVDDDAAAVAILSTYIKTVSQTLPSGSQNGYGARVWADAVAMSISDTPLSLDPAFATGVVQPDDAAAAMIDYAGRLAAMYGDEALGSVQTLSTVHDIETGTFQRMSLDEAIAKVCDPAEW